MIALAFLAISAALLLSPAVRQWLESRIDVPAPAKPAPKRSKPKRTKRNERQG